MFGNKLKISSELYSKLKVAAEIAGASSVEEFAMQLLDAEASRVIASTGSREVSKEDVESIANSLKGLGYLE